MSPSRSRRPGTILITGASSGIGRALALEYARAGTKLALCARREADLEETARSARELGGSALCIPLDVTNVDAVAEAVKRADRELGGLDMVIANAGRGDEKGVQRGRGVEAGKKVCEIDFMLVSGGPRTN